MFLCQFWRDFCNCRCVKSMKYKSRIPDLHCKSLRVLFQEVWLRIDTLLSTFLVDYALSRKRIFILRNAKLKSKGYPIAFTAHLLRDVKKFQWLWPSINAFPLVRMENFVRTGTTHLRVSHNLGFKMEIWQRCSSSNL